MKKKITWQQIVAKQPNYTCIRIQSSSFSKCKKFNLSTMTSNLMFSEEDISKKQTFTIS